MSVQTNTIRVLLADDHALLLQGMASILKANPACEIVAEAHDGQQAITLYREHCPDVVVLDIEMPNLNGIEAIQQIRAHDANARIIVLSAHDQDEIVYRAIQAGAMSYVLKEALVEDLFRAIISVHSGKRLLAEKIAAKYIDHATAPALSERELDVLKYVADGCSNDEIAQHLHLATGTVKVHIHNILQKLSVRDRTAAVVTAVRRGLIQI